MRNKFNLLKNKVWTYLNTKITKNKPRNKKQAVALIALVMLISSLIFGLVGYIITGAIIYQIIIYLIVFIELLVLAVDDRDFRLLLMKCLGLPALLIILLITTLILSLNTALMFSEYGSHISGIAVEHWLGYFGAVIGASITVLGSLGIITYQHLKEKQYKNQVLNLIVDNFLMKEIKSNLLVIKSIPNFSMDSLSLIINDDKSEEIRPMLIFYYNVDNIKINLYEEYKNDLIKYDDVKLLKEILEIYKMFELFIANKRLLDFSKEQLIFTRDTFMRYEKKYIGNDIPFYQHL